MKVAVDVNHPAHVHFFRPFVERMQDRGHQVLIAASDKDVALQLLRAYGMAHVNLGSYGRTLAQKLLRLGLMDARMYRVLRRFQPDLVLGIGSVRAAHAAWLLGKPCFSFEDTETSPEQYALYAPFVTRVFTPDSFLRELGAKQNRYRGQHELAYLRPDYFQPDLRRLEPYGIAADRRFILVRFVSWQASHDLRESGIVEKINFIRELEQLAPVLISAEGTVPPELAALQVELPPELMHHLLAAAALYIGEGATMASEAAILGTPAIYVSTLASRLGVFRQLQQYGLLEACPDQQQALAIARRCLADPDQMTDQSERRRRYLAETIDVTKLMIETAEAVSS